MDHWISNTSCFIWELALECTYKGNLGLVKLSKLHYMYFILHVNLSFLHFWSPLKSHLNIDDISQTFVNKSCARWPETFEFYLCIRNFSGLVENGNYSKMGCGRILVIPLYQYMYLAVLFCWASVMKSKHFSCMNPWS